MPQRSRQRTAALKVKALIEPTEAGEQPSGDVVAYAFSSGGHLVATAPVDQTGAASLSVALTDEPTGARIIIGPKLDKPDLGELLRRGGVETSVRLDPKALQPVTIDIGREAWLCWFRAGCTARGTVLKRTTHNGEALDLPVCGAVVEVYEVDPLWVLIPRLPDDVIVAIRDEILRRPPVPPEEVPVVKGPPGPGPGPGPRPGPAAFHDEAPAPSSESAAALAGPAAASLRLTAQIGDAAQLRRQLVLQPGIAQVLICAINPRLVTKTLIGRTTTDECGHFRHRFFQGCRNADQPDLYFRVLQPLFLGLEIPIYEPTPVACYTHWDYQCGREVTIYTSSPFAQTCSPCPPLDPGGNGNYVAVMHIGNRLISNINGVRAGEPWTAANRGLTTNGEPFGGTLNPHLEFDPQLRESLGVKYYRVTVQRPGSSPRQLDAPCYRHYRHTVPGGQVVEPYPLGPNTAPNGTANLYEIPPAVPPLGVWSTPNPYEDQANSKWDSTMEAPGVPDPQADRSGKFELRIELFTSNGDPVDMAALNISWLVPRELSVTGAIVLHLDPPAAGIVQGNAFLLPLHVDNNPCLAATEPPVLNGSSAADHCGVLRYTPPQASGGSVQLPYTARHRNGFATYSFTVQRGVEVVTPPSTSNQDVGGGSFAPTETVLSLLTPLQPPPPGPAVPPCTIGAFLELVYVSAKATDGWSTLTGYDAAASRAFTLAPA